MAISEPNIVWRKNRIAAYALLAILVSTSCGKKVKQALPYYNTPDFTPIWIENSEAAKPLHQVGSFTCTDQQGNMITEKTMEGKITVVSFFFTSCGGICPKIVNNLKTVDGRFSTNGKVQLFSYSVTPEIDTLERLQWYEQKNDLQSLSWHLLRGNKSEIYKLARQSYFAEEEMGFTKDSTDFLHTEHVLLIDPQRHIRGVYNGTIALDAERLADDIRILSAE